MGDAIGLAACGTVIGALSYLLHSFAGRSRLRRALLWAGIWFLGGWLWASLAVAIDGTHQVNWSRATQTWVEVHWTRAGAAAFGLAIGVIGALAALMLPWSQPGSVSQVPRRRKARRGTHRRAGG